MIYFLQHPETQLIKIGTTRRYNMRLSQLIANHGDLELMGLMSGSFNEEYTLHRQFRKYNVRDVLDGDEWFKPHAELLDFIRKNTSLKCPLDIHNHNSIVKNRIPETIRQLMTDYEIKTNKEMAARLEIDPGALSRMLRMEPGDLVSIHILGKLLSEFGLTPNDVLLIADEVE